MALLGLFYLARPKAKNNPEEMLGEFPGHPREKKKFFLGKTRPGGATDSNSIFFVNQDGTGTGNRNRRNRFYGNRNRNWSYVSVGLLGSREQGNLRKCSPSALESALRNRGALGSALESALEGLVTVQNNRKSTVESTLGSTPESTPISESTLESTRGALLEISLFSAP